VHVRSDHMNIMFQFGHTICKSTKELQRQKTHTKKISLLPNCIKNNENTKALLLLFFTAHFDIAVHNTDYILTFF